jgi:hypothetical protein
LPILENVDLYRNADRLDRPVTRAPSATPDPVDEQRAQKCLWPITNEGEPRKGGEGEAVETPDALSRPAFAQL